MVDPFITPVAKGVTDVVFGIVQKVTGNVVEGFKNKEQVARASNWSLD